MMFSPPKFAFVTVAAIGCLWPQTAGAQSAPVEFVPVLAPFMADGRNSSCSYEKDVVNVAGRPVSVSVAAPLVLVDRSGRPVERLEIAAGGSGRARIWDTAALNVATENETRSLVFRVNGADVVDGMSTAARCATAPPQVTTTTAPPVTTTVPPVTTTTPATPQVTTTVPTATTSTTVAPAATLPELGIGLTASNVPDNELPYTGTATTAAATLAGALILSGGAILWVARQARERRIRKLIAVIDAMSGNLDGDR